MACYNRKETTLRCLERLFGQSNQAGVDMHVYLLDDASPDGTGDAVRKAYYPSVNVLDGTGNLYWNGGMRVAFGAAIEQGHDFYLWLNDDVEPNSDAIDVLFSTYEMLSKKHGYDIIVSGAMADPATGATSYGGLTHSSSVWTLNFDQVSPHQTEARECETVLGNLVLIPSLVVNKIGNLAPNYMHNYGDQDYGIRANKTGTYIFLCPGHLGTCEPNERKGGFHDPDASIIEKWKAVGGPHGVRFRETMHFCYMYRGISGVLLGLPTYRRLLGL